MRLICPLWALAVSLLLGLVPTASGQRFVRSVPSITELTTVIQPQDVNTNYFVRVGLSGKGESWFWDRGATDAASSSVLASTVNAGGRFKKIAWDFAVDVSGFITNYTVVTVPTVADLKNVPVTNGLQLVMVEAFANPGDGGGGDFVYDATSGEPDDGGIIHAPNNGGGRWLRIVDPLGGVRVPWWSGMVTNGTVDAAITYASAHTNANTVVVPGGLHQIDAVAGITMKSNVRLVGDAGASFAVAANPATNYAILNFAPGATNMTIANIEFQGWNNAPGDSANFGRAFTVAGVTNLTWFGCSFTNFWSVAVKMGTNDYAGITPIDRDGSLNTVLAFGATREDGNDDSAAIREAVASSKASRLTLVFPGGWYRGTNNTDITGLDVVARGAIIEDARWNVSASTNGTSWDGGLFKYYNLPWVQEVFSINGGPCVIQNARIRYDPELTGVDGPNTVSDRDNIAWTPIEIGNNAVDVSILNCELNHPLRAALIMLSGRNIRVDNCFLHSIDDGFSIKASTGPAQDIFISNCIFTNSATGIGLGTELRYDVNNVSIRQCTFRNMVGPLRIKPGSGTIYTNRVVSNVLMDGFQVIDDQGSRYQYAIFLTSFAGMLVDGVVVRNGQIMTRCKTNQEPRAFAYITPGRVPQIAAQYSLASLTRTGTVVTGTTTGSHAFQIGHSIVISGAIETDYNGVWAVTGIGPSTFTFTIGTTPSSPATGTNVVTLNYEASTMRNITIENVTCISPTNGAGYGVDFGFQVIPHDGATLDNLLIRNCRIQGAENGGIFINPQIDPSLPLGVLGDIQLDGIEIIDCNTVATNGASISIAGNPTLNIGRVFIDPAPSTGAVPPVRSTTNGLVRAASNISGLGVVGAGRDLITKTVWVAPEHSWVHKISIMDPIGIPQNDTNYITLSWRNIHTGQRFATNNTTLSGINLTAGTWVDIATTNFYEGSYFTNTSPMAVDLQHVGAGQKVNSLFIKVGFVPFSGGHSIAGGVSFQDTSIIEPDLKIRGESNPLLILESTHAVPEPRISFREGIGGPDQTYINWDSAANTFALRASKAGSSLYLGPQDYITFAPGFGVARGRWFTSGGLAINAAAEISDPGPYKLGIRAGDSTRQWKPGGTVYVDGVAVANVDAGEDDLKTHSLGANMLKDSAENWHFEMGFSFAANASSKRVRAYLGATLIFDTGAQNQNGEGLVISGRILRGGTAATETIFAQSSGATLFPPGTTYTAGAEDLTTALVLKATGEAVNTGDISHRYLMISEHPLH